MSVLKNLSRIYNSAEQIPYNDYSRFILMSDCHRGDGSRSDSFYKNENIFLAALTHYYNKNYTYIELGDGDELWENKELSDIIRVHSKSFALLSKLYKEGRLYFIFGNHDMVKKNSYTKPNFYRKIKIHEALVLRHADTEDKIFLLHGHQADFINNQMWKWSRFLVRYVWKRLELIGVQDPTSTAKNYKKRGLIERKLAGWAIEENKMLIAGHTHRSVFPEVGEPLYFNDGSCVHPNCITGIEITDGNISLVKWCYKMKKDGTKYIGRDILAGPRKLKDYTHKSNVSK